MKYLYSKVEANVQGYARDTLELNGNKLKKYVDSVRPKFTKIIDEFIRWAKEERETDIDKRDSLEDYIKSLPDDAIREVISEFIE